jgi:hypothetical protein
MHKSYAVKFNHINEVSMLYRSHISVFDIINLVLLILKATLARVKDANMMNIENCKNISHGLEKNLKKKDDEIKQSESKKKSVYLVNKESPKVRQ